MNQSDTESESGSEEEGEREVKIEDQLLWSMLHDSLTANRWATRFKAGQFTTCSFGTSNGF